MIPQPPIRLHLMKFRETLMSLHLWTHLGQAEADDSPERVFGDSTIKPSERQSTYEKLLEERRENLEGIEARIVDVEAKAEQVRAKLEATGVDLDTLLGSPASGGAGEGWASYLDEESGQFYWYNDLTGEAYYDGYDDGRIS